MQNLLWYCTRGLLTAAVCRDDDSMKPWQAYYVGQSVDLRARLLQHIDKARNFSVGKFKSEKANMEKLYSLELWLGLIMATQAGKYDFNLHGASDANLDALVHAFKKRSLVVHANRDAAAVPVGSDHITIDVFALCTFDARASASCQWPDYVHVAAEAAITVSMLKHPHHFCMNSAITGEFLLVSVIACQWL
jgi:hypothetical protein